MKPGHQNVKHLSTTPKGAGVVIGNRTYPIVTPTWRYCRSFSTCVKLDDTFQENTGAPMTSAGCGPVSTRTLPSVVDPSVASAGSFRTPYHSIRGRRGKAGGRTMSCFCRSTKIVPGYSSCGIAGSNCVLTTPNEWQGDVNSGASLVASIASQLRGHAGRFV